MQYSSLFALALVVIVVCAGKLRERLPKTLFTLIIFSFRCLQIRRHGSRPMHQRQMPARVRLPQRRMLPRVRQGRQVDQTSPRRRHWAMHRRRLPGRILLLQRRMPSKPRIGCEEEPTRCPTTYSILKHSGSMYLLQFFVNKFIESSMKKEII